MRSVWSDSVSVDTPNLNVLPNRKLSPGKDTVLEVCTNLFLTGNNVPVLSSRSLLSTEFMFSL